ncbi:MAG: flagellar export protein FliJ [Nitrospirae bacterium]|jgi:flagellar FliJ protein|nr:flagellar export protein FliJ [Nitrospirota bacterium]
MTKKKTLTKVIELKEFKQDQIESELKHTYSVLNMEKEKLENLERMFKKTDSKLNSFRNREPMNVSEITIYYDYLTYLNRKIEEQKNIVFRIAAELEIKKAEMFEVYKERRVVEKLRDKILKEENRNLLQKEQKEIDYDFISKSLRK